MDTNKPFTHEFVIRETLRKMLVNISVSTQKTLARLPEFRDDEEKKQEILRTLASLNALDRMVKEVIDHNKDIL